MKLPIEMVVALLAGASCLFAWPGLELPIWALFIGWAWYFALGATPGVMKNIYPSIIPGALLATLSIVLINYLSGMMPVMAAMIITVILTVYVLMLAIKIPLMNCSLAAFNAYSTIFAVYYGGFYHQSGDFNSNVLMALFWGVAGNALGPLFGYLSVRLSRAV